MENKPKVAFQGEPGAYSEEAAFKFFSESIEPVGCKTFSSVFESVEKESAEYGIVPVENSLEGTVGKVYDLFLEHDLKPRGEIFHRIRHCLISFPGKSLESIKTVYSHPQALGQCRDFLEKQDYEMVPVYDTAGGVRMVKEKGLENSAGIASEIAAEIYKMKVVQKGIETNPHNYTRFLVLAEKGAEPTGEDKTSIIFSTKHIPGALFRVLGVFAQREINLTKIESRPIAGKPWEYNFYLDFEGHIREEKTKEALEELRKHINFLKIIGSYPRAELRYNTNNAL